MLFGLLINKGIIVIIVVVVVSVAVIVAVAVAVVIVTDIVQLPLSMEKELSLISKFKSPDFCYWLRLYHARNWGKYEKSGLEF